MPNVTSIIFNPTILQNLQVMSIIRIQLGFKNLTSFFDLKISLVRTSLYHIICLLRGSSSTTVSLQPAATFGTSSFSFSKTCATIVISLTAFEGVIALKYAYFLVVVL
jgi:hypothetical protein